MQVGDDPDPLSTTNLLCNEEEFDTTHGVEQSCDLPGRYMTLSRPGKDRLGIHGVAIFMDCKSPLLPWDAIDDAFPESTQTLGETQTYVIPLLTELETALGVDVCGELQVQFTDLPSFCTFSRETLTCSPTRKEHYGEKKFLIKQVALEHLSSAKITQAKITVIAPTPDPVPERETITVSD